MSNGGSDQDGKKPVMRPGFNDPFAEGGAKPGPSQSGPFGPGPAAGVRPAPLMGGARPAPMPGSSPKSEGFGTAGGISSAKPAAIPGGGGAGGAQRTVIGGALPVSPSGGAPAPQRTVIGGAMPISPGQQSPQAPGWGAAAAPAWGAQPAQPAAPAWGASAQQPAQGVGGAPQGGWGGAAPQGNAWGGAQPAGAGGAGWAGAQAPSQSFFPEPRRPEPAQRAPTHKISLEAALNTRVDGHSAEANPITAAAASLLILFGRLRSQIVDMQAVPLMSHVVEEIERFERRMQEMGVDQMDVMVAKYCVCGTADDIVQNLPGTDRAVWLQYSMVARFFNRRTSGVGFYQEVEKALADPMRKYHLLELMLTCLSLGFEGQYRNTPGGDVELQRARRQIYETLRRVKARGDDDVAPHWQPVEVAAKKTGRGTPVWLVALLCIAILSGAFVTLRSLLVGDGNGLAARMTSLHPSDPVKINRLETVTAFVAYVPPEPETAQIDRIKAALATEISAGLVSVDTRGDFLLVGVNNLVLFDSGKADVKPEFPGLATKIAEALNPEPGPIRIVGHTDNVPLKGRGRFKDNFELSIARATSVADVVKSYLTDATRLAVDGKGEDEPIADNATPEGRAENRRVEIMVQREETLASAVGDAASAEVAPAEGAPAEGAATETQP